MRTIEVDAVIENGSQVTAIIDEILENADCPMKTQMQVDIVIDEIFSNIARYAYGDSVGKAVIEVDIAENPKAIVLRFIDSGVAYNPLDKEDPDISLSAQEREIGGLGIFMVKKMVDNLVYEYKDNQNILTITKNFG